ncbi:DUF5666 domain-containing protein [Cryobacterium sp. CG_9.6]|uniref:DUF5666 domain-containing protein n=1 Tax=Cryobacterium sp. CG_9.6 TaxID=2760710 RepID=UPI0024744C3A|nr:DUF5666 domain-containing protein [Cryobacterium sp. CG_9.6]MDH6237720.1 hypothetical protein [Cryobacterium sp. CG_9.6]
MKRLTEAQSITSLSSKPVTRRRAPLIIGAVAAAALVLGGAGAAFAADSTSDSTDASSSAPLSRPVHEPHIHGTVVSVNGSTITVTDRDGFTRTILTSGDTEYADGLSADLATGTEIHAAGTVNSNGTSLDATTITTAPAGPMDGAGPGSKGDRGDRGDRPTPPTDAPDVSPTDAPSEQGGTSS